MDTGGRKLSIGAMKWFFNSKIQRLSVSFNRRNHDESTVIEMQYNEQ